MNNKRKDNPFLTPEMQNLLDSLKKITDSYSGYFQTIFSSDLMNYQIAQLQEEIIKPYKQIFQTYTPPLISSLNESFSKVSEIINSTVQESISTVVYSNLNESLKSMIPFFEFQQQIQNITPEFFYHLGLPVSQGSLGDLPEDDFVIIDEPAIKTYELPDSVCIPIGNTRFKMPTSFLLALISLIITTFTTLFIFFAQSVSDQTEQFKQMQIEEAQLELQKAQNKLLQQLLHNLDTSSSSEAELLKELKETVEELNKQCSPTQDTCSPVEADNDNSESTEDTDIQE